MSEFNQQQFTQDDNPFVIEGTLTELNWDIGKQNLFAKIDRYYKEKNAITALGAAVSDLYGNAATSAMVAMYDGDETQKFICLIEDQVVCGQFAGAEHFPDQGHVKAVVSKKNGLLIAHAMMAPEKGLLWVHHPYGYVAERFSSLKWTIGLSIFALIGMILMGGISWGFGTEKFYDGLKYTLGGLPLVAAIILWPVGDGGKEATEIFRMLGFPQPERINLNNYGLHSISIREHLRDKTENYSTQGFSEYQYRDVYCYKKAIEDGKIKMAPQ